MKKRILLIVAFGVSFAPAAFAAQGPLGFSNCLSQTGEASGCQADAMIAGGGTRCELAEAEAAVRKDQEATDRQNAAPVKARGAIVEQQPLPAEANS